MQYLCISGSKSTYGGLQTQRWATESENSVMQKAMTAWDT